LKKAARQSVEPLVPGYRQNSALRNLTMQNIQLRPQRRKRFRLADCHADLFEWAAGRMTNPPPPIPRAVSHLMRRSQLSQTFAALAAIHAGLGGFDQ
jgi:hypothetical protein